MRALEFSVRQLKRMQYMRDEGLGVREVGQLYGCSGTWVCRHTLNPSKFKTKAEQEVAWNERFGS